MSKVDEVIAGKYRVIREIGEGSTGQVLLVEHLELNAKYALKLLDRSLSSDEKSIERFKREAEVLIRFTHPGSVQLRDFGKTEDGHYYMTMDFCDGKSLKALLEDRNSLSVSRVLELVIEVLDVLEAAHQFGIVHRDIKPENIVLEQTQNGSEIVRVLDFGIAKLKERDGLSLTITMEGASIGTPQYMSPEQAAGEVDIDLRTDLYSLGIVMYELLSGQAPFIGRSVMHTLLLQLTQDPAPFPENLKIPQIVEEIILRALRKEKEKRFQTATEFKDACQVALRDENINAVVAVKEHHSFGGKIEPFKEGSFNVLCLDDDPLIVNILDHLLSREGFSVRTATDWSVIHGYLFEQNVDLLISDVEMPGMKGSAICQLLKAATPKLKIILFSNIPERELEKLAKESRADAWISKGTVPSEWVKIIREVLQRNEKS